MEKRIEKRKHILIVLRFCVPDVHCIVVHPIFQPIIYLLISACSRLSSENLMKVSVHSDGHSHPLTFCFSGAQQAEHEDGMFFEEDEIFGEDHEEWSCLEL